MGNRVRCKMCGVVLESTHVHDFRRCHCPNLTFTDGGEEYQRYGGMDPRQIEILESPTRFPDEVDSTLMRPQEYVGRVRWLSKRFAYMWPMHHMYYDIELGWLRLIEKLCQDINALLDDSERARAAFHWEQIKEKCGTLRAYCSARELPAEKYDRIQALVETAETESATVCQRCGAAGELCERHGWWSTLCQQHLRTNQRVRTGESDWELQR